MSSRRFCFTWNNPPQNEIDFESMRSFKYASWQRERGESGTEHLQGYVELSASVRWKHLQCVLGTAHIEISRGSRQQARDYTRKEESRISGPWECGVFTGQGERSDLTEIKRKLDEGVDESTIAEEHFGSWCRNRKSFMAYKALKSVKRNFKSRVVVLWGPPGTGKTFYAHQQGPVYMINSKSYPWFDNYNGIDNVLFDDFYGWVPFHHFLTLLDAYPCQVQVKGGFVNWCPKTIFITSNRAPNTWYTDPNLEQQALMRRIEEIKEMLIRFNN